MNDTLIFFYYYQLFFIIITEISIYCIIIYYYLFFLFFIASINGLFHSSNAFLFLWLCFFIVNIILINSGFINSIIFVNYSFSIENFSLITSTKISHIHYSYVLYETTPLHMHSQHCNYLFYFLNPTRNHKIHHDFVMKFWFPPKIHHLIVLNFWIPDIINNHMVYNPPPTNPINYYPPKLNQIGSNLLFYFYHYSYNFITYKLIDLFRTLFHFTYYQRIRLGLSLYSQF